MCIYGSITSSSGKIFILPIDYMFIGSAITILLGKAKIYNVDQIATFTQTHKKIVWLDIPVYEVFTMYIFYSIQLKNKTIILEIVI